MARRIKDRKPRSAHRAEHLADAVVDGDDSGEGAKLLRWIGVVDAKIKRVDALTRKIVDDPDVTAAARAELDALKTQRRELVEKLVKLGARPALLEFVATESLPIGRRAEHVAKFKAGRPARLRAHLRRSLPSTDRPGGATVGPALLSEIDQIDAAIGRLEKSLLAHDRDADVEEASKSALKALRRRRKGLVRRAVDLGAGLVAPDDIEAQGPAWWPGDDDADDGPASVHEAQARSALSELLAGAGIKKTDPISAAQVVELMAVPMGLGMERRAVEYELLNRLAGLEDAMTKRLADIERRGVVFEGGYQRARDYRRGSIVIAHGSSWAATKDITAGEAPPSGDGTGGSPWQLIAKAGRDARDGKSGRSYSTKEMTTGAGE